MDTQKIQIGAEAHKLLKIYCAQHSLKMGEFVEQLIKTAVSIKVDNVVENRSERSLFPIDKKLSKRKTEN